VVPLFLSTRRNMSVSLRPTSETFALSIQPWVSLTRVKYFAGTMVVFWPYAWGLTMAARSALLPVPRFFFVLACGFIGAALSHSAGCVWNDILDRNFDRQVERTKLRPIAAGKISVPGAVTFLFAHLGIMISMVWHVNPLAWKIALASMFPLAGIYPYMKRVTFWPQAWLAISINTGVVMSWAFVTGTVPTSSLVLYAGTWAWTLWYDTIYACQDKKDDAKAGVKSTALLFGSYTKAVLGTFSAIMVAALFVAGIMNQQQLPYFLLSVVGCALYLGIELYTVDIDSPKSCWDVFHRNGFNLGGLVWAGLLVDYLLAVKGATLGDFSLY